MIVIMIDGSEKRNYMYEGGLGTLEFAVKTIAKLPQEFVGTPTWPPFHSFETPIQPQ